MTRCSIGDVGCFLLSSSGINNKTDRVNNVYNAMKWKVGECFEQHMF